MNEEITKAYQTAELLCQDLRGVYRKVNKDRPTVTQELATMQVSDLLGKAIDLKISLQGLQR